MRRDRRRNGPSAAYNGSTSGSRRTLIVARTLRLRRPAAEQRPEAARVENPERRPRSEREEILVPGD